MIDFGVTPGEFRDKHLERAPYLKRAAMSERPFDWPALNEFLHRLEPTPDLLQLVREGVIPQEHYTEDVIDLGRPRRVLNKHRFYGLLQNGATLIANRMELHSTAAKQVCAAVGRFVNQQTLCNAYLSFGGQGTFGKHWDTHDVFAVQLIGSKRWQVFRPTFSLPLSQHTSESMSSALQESPVLDVLMQPGDLLYIPRGWWHRVSPLPEASFHLSVGAYLPTVYDFMMWASSRLLPQREVARKGIGGAADVPKDVACALQYLADALRDPLHLQTFLSELQQREQMRSEFNLALILDPCARDLSPTTPLRLTSQHAVCFESGELVVNGARLRFDTVMEGIVRTVAATGDCTVGHVFEHFEHTARDEVRARLLELARRDIVSIGAA